MNKSHEKSKTIENVGNESVLLLIAVCVAWLSAPLLYKNSFTSILHTKSCCCKTSPVHKCVTPLHKTLPSDRALCWDWMQSKCSSSVVANLCFVCAQSPPTATLTNPYTRYLFCSVFFSLYNYEEVSRSLGTSSRLFAKVKLFSTHADGSSWVSFISDIYKNRTFASSTLQTTTTVVYF